MTGASIDVEYGSFTDHGPWVIDPDQLSWKKGLDRVRRDVHASVPTLTRYRRVPPAGRMLTTLRALGLPLAVWALRERKTDQSIPKISRRLRIAAERLGPTYIKLGQIIKMCMGF